MLKLLALNRFSSCFCRKQSENQIENKHCCHNYQSFWTHWKVFKNSRNSQSSKDSDCKSFSFCHFLFIIELKFKRLQERWQSQESWTAKHRFLQRFESEARRMQSAIRFSSWYVYESKTFQELCRWTQCWNHLFIHLNCQNRNHSSAISSVYMLSSQIHDSCFLSHRIRILLNLFKLETLSASFRIKHLRDEDKNHIKSLCILNTIKRCISNLWFFSMCSLISTRAVFRFRKCKLYIIFSSIVLRCIVLSQLVLNDMICRFRSSPLCFRKAETELHFNQVCMLSFLVLQEIVVGIWFRWIRIVLTLSSIDFLNHWRILGLCMAQSQHNHFNESHLETIFCLKVNARFRCICFTRKQVVVKQSLSLSVFSQLLWWFKSLRCFFTVINQSWWQVFLNSNLQLLLHVDWIQIFFFWFHQWWYTVERSLVCQSSCFFIR